VEELGLGGRHGARGRHLHQMTLYEGVIDVEDVKYELEKVEAYLSDVGRVLGVKLGGACSVDGADAVLWEKLLSAHRSCMWESMSYVVTIDDRGRILLPADVRRKLGLRKGSKLILRVAEGGRLEAVPLERELERVAEVFRRRFAGWREEDHEATAVLFGVVGESGAR
jgi:AbrB family looped-hinge helix DNA binding protein